VPFCERASAELHAEDLGDDEIVLQLALDMRYVGQSYELPVVLGNWNPEVEGWGVGWEEGRHIENFHAVHRQRFSYASEGEPVEIVNLRLKAMGRTAKPQFVRRPLGDLDPKAAHVGYKPVYFAGGESASAARPIPCALYERERLAPGNMVVGPAVVFQLDTTTVVPPTWAATVDAWGNLIIETTER
jgi:N-methylhydantoinase A